MEIIQKGKYEFAHEELLQIWESNGRKDDSVLNWIYEKIIRDTLEDDKNKEIKKKVVNFCSYIRKHLPNCNRLLSRFKEKHAKWLASIMIVVVENKDCKSASASKLGRPNLNYEEAGLRLKRKLAFDLSTEQEHNTQLLAHAAAVAAKKSKKNDLAYVLKESLASSSKACEIRKKLRSKEPLPLTPEEALTFLLENSLSKQQYINIRMLNKNRHCNIYPSYHAEYEAKLKCRPIGITVVETMAEVSLQNILEHTAGRILLMQAEVLNQIEINDMKLIASYGFDGTTGQSMYKQQFEGDVPESLDQSLFVTTLIPLKLIDSLDRVIWCNQTPQSIRFCRPIKIQFIKESKNHILTEKASLDLQINSLTPLEYNLNGQHITISYDLHMTLIDGKVLNVLTGTNSSQCCPVCGAKPKDFLITKDFKSSVFTKKPGALEYGVSPLHAWIRFLEFVLKISYRIGINKWQIRDEKDKGEMRIRKQNIQKRLWEEMGLHVDKPKPNGCGSTNDGNTARRAFLNAETFASILEFDVEILKKFYFILISISCEYQINAAKFESFCSETASLYMEKYSWFPMSATVHKILIHGSDIIRASVVPVGCLGENAAEARNKFYKKDRNTHARKSSRASNLSDVFHRAMDSSDPLISSLCANKRRNTKIKRMLPQEVVALLAAPQVAMTPEKEQTDEDEDEHNDSDNDETANDFNLYNDFSIDLDVNKDLE